MSNNFENAFVKKLLTKIFVLVFAKKKSCTNLFFAKIILI